MTRMSEDKLNAHNRYDDEPYKAEKEEEWNLETQYNDIEDKLKALDAKIDPDSVEHDDASFMKYKEIMDDAESIHDEAMERE